MVGREDRGQVEASNALLEHDHQQGPPWPHDQDEQRRKRQRVEAQRAGLDPAQPVPGADEELHALEVHRPSEAEDEHEEQARLVADDPARKTALGDSLLLGVRDHADVDVRVEVDVVGIAVVAVVLVDPPSVTHP